LPVLVYDIIMLTENEITLFNMKIIQKIKSLIIKKKFKVCGNGFYIYSNVTINNHNCISLGSNVGIGKYSYLLPCVKYKGAEYTPQIKIGNNVWLGIRTSIACIDEVVIGNDVLFAGHVHITDHSHGYDQIDVPIRNQPLISKGKVIIEDQCWLGFSCEILSGVHIGKHSIVAARAVVTKDVPPYSIVAGNPARIIKQYNFESRKWEKVK